MTSSTTLEGLKFKQQLGITPTYFLTCYDIAVLFFFFLIYAYKIKLRTPLILKAPVSTWCIQLKSRHPFVSAALELLNKPA